MIPITIKQIPPAAQVATPTPPMPAAAPHAAGANAAQGWRSRRGALTANADTAILWSIATAGGWPDVAQDRAGPFLIEEWAKPMSDHWEFFPCTMGEDAAFIFTDVGIGDQLSKTAPANLFKVRLDYKAPSENGLPTNSEFGPATAIEDEIQAYADSLGDRYVGRITVAGQRHFFVYVKDWGSYAEKVQEIGQRHGYDLRHAMIDDPGHSQYWDHLWPTDSDWRVIHDMKVIQALDDAGDDHSMERNVDHWIYFDDPQAAVRFKDWAVEFGMEEACPIQEVEKRHLVRLKHRGTMLLADITCTTIPLSLKAIEAGGDYDGWETEVMRSSDATDGGSKRRL